MPVDQRQGEPDGAQEQQGGHVTEPMIRVIADMLSLSAIRVLEIATFYTMFNLHPVG